MPDEQILLTDTPIQLFGTDDIVVLIGGTETPSALSPVTDIVTLAEQSDQTIILFAFSAGPPGPPGTADKYYVHTQNSAATVWTIIHNLNKNPAISVVDSGGTQVIGQVNYIDVNNATVTFSVAFGGYAYCD